MSENWKVYKFSELYDIASGLSKSRDQFGFGFPFVIMLQMRTFLFLKFPKLLDF
jgi:hypothetical protein